MRAAIALSALLAVLCSPFAAAGDVAWLVFRVGEPGVDPYYSRYLVDENWLRIDEGAGSEGFILFDRAARTLYSVESEAESVLVIEARPLAAEPPMALDYRESEEGGAVRATVNGEFCQAVTPRKGALPGVVAALADYRRVLAGEHALTIAATPTEFLHPCDLALNVFHADRHLRHGLPLELADWRGYRRELVDYAVGETPEAGWNRLPEGYDRITSGEAPAH